MTLVVKFGGTSMQDPSVIRHSASIPLAELQKGRRVVTVVSAMAGVTNQLLELAHAAPTGDSARTNSIISELRERHQAAARELGNEQHVGALLDELDRLVQGLGAVGELTPRSKDAVVGFGERLSSQLMAAALDGVAITGGDAGIVTNDNFGSAEPLAELTAYEVSRRLGAMLDAGKRVVVTGFLGQTQHGVQSTLGRGGSDFTATILGAALNAEEVWICSDVDGLLSADPRVIDNARLLERVSYAEAIEMGQFGAKSLHPLALEPAAEKAVPVRMRSTFNTENPGTLICADVGDDRGPVRCVPMLKDAALLTVSGAAMIGRPGTAAELFRVLADAGVNIYMISQSVSEAGISMVISAAHAETAKSALEATMLRSGVARRVHVDPGVQVVAAVGSGMRGTKGVAAGVFGSLADKGVNVLAIAQGSSELSISFAVERGSGPDAVRAIHDAFGLGGA